MLRPTGLRGDAGRALAARAAGRFARFAALAGRFDLDRFLAPDLAALAFGRDRALPDFRFADEVDRFIFLGLRDLDPLPGRLPAMRTPLCETSEHTSPIGA